ncbi:MAG: V-type ATP synthase subunit D [Candidatus Bathyarchaeia archaeon]
MASRVISGVRPTRMELLMLKKRRMLAQRGHDLLQEKRDALVMEFFGFIHEIAPLRAKAYKALIEGYAACVDAQMMIGSRKLEEISLSIPDRYNLDVKMRNVIGVTIPLFKLVEKGELKGTIQYNLLETSSRLDEAVEKLRVALVAVIRLAEVEAAIRRLAEAIIVTKRRVNALKYRIIPLLTSTVNYIEMQLEEREREDFFRLKRIKTLHEVKAGKSKIFQEFV